MLESKDRQDWKIKSTSERPMGTAAYGGKGFKERKGRTEVSTVVFFGRHGQGHKQPAPLPLASEDSGTAGP